MPQYTSSVWLHFAKGFQKFKIFVKDKVCLRFRQKGIGNDLGKFRTNFGIFS